MGELVELDVTTVEESVTVNVTEEGQVDIAVFAEKGDTGPAGPAGPNSVTSATTSDGTANLSLSNVTTATATVTGTLTADHIHGNIAGSVYAHVRAGENLAKGDPVYISGSHGTGANLIAIVSKADASNAAKMPAVGVMDAAVSANANGHMVITGTISDIDTNAYAVNSVLYVASGGGFTTTPPNDNSQPVAIVERSNTNNGAVIVKVNGLATSNGYANPQKLLRTDATGQLTIGNTIIATESTLAYVSVMNETYPHNTADLAVNGLGVSELYLGTSATAGGSVLAQNLTDFRTYQLPNASGTLALTSNIPTLGTNVATFLATPTSANLAAAVTDETGTGSLVFSNAPTFTGGLQFSSSAVAATTRTNLGVLQSRSVTKASDETRTSTTFAADSDLVISLEASSTYKIELYYFHTITAGTLSARAEYTGTLLDTLINDTAGTYHGFSQGRWTWTSVSPPYVNLASGTAATPVAWLSTFSLKTGDAGNFRLLWSGGTGTGGGSGNVTVKQGSRIIATKLL